MSVCSWPSGAVFGSIDPVANDTIGSLEWDGVNIRVANVTTGSGSINTINPTTGGQIGTIPAPAGRGEGLGYDGVHLYYSTINPTFKGVWSIGANFAPLPLPDTRHGQYLRRHTR